MIGGTRGAASTAHPILNDEGVPMARGRSLRYCSAGAAVVIAVLTLTAPRGAAAQSTADTEWRHFGHDAANTK